MDKADPSHTGLDGPSDGSVSSPSNRPSSRLSVDRERSLTPSNGDGGSFSRSATPVYLKRAKRQAPKPPSKVTSGAGIDVTLSDTDREDDIKEISDMDDQEHPQMSSHRMTRPYTDRLSGRSSPAIPSTMDNHVFNHPNQTSGRSSPAMDNQLLTHRLKASGRCSPAVPISSMVYGPPGFDPSHYEMDPPTSGNGPPMPGLSRVMIRLIDDEDAEDLSESCSSTTEEAKPIHVKLSATPITTTTTTTTSAARGIQYGYLPTVLQHYEEYQDQQHVSQGLNDIILPNAQNDITVRRGRARRLMHSASDPGMARSRPLNYARPPKCTPTPPPPLEQLSETEEEYENTTQHSYSGYDSELQKVLSNNDRKCRLERSDSVITVAHIYEDLLVAPRLRLRVTLTNLTAVVVVAAFVMPNTATLLYNGFRLIFGTLFPAYYSYKAIKTKSVEEYVKWMMYWIVFAFFTCFETLTDVFLSFWFPFYYEIKILVVLWLLSPATRGSSILYRKFVHPWLTQREDHIDDYIAKAKQQGYTTVMQLGTKGVNYATNILMQTAIKGGGGIVSQLRRSYSTGEIGEDGEMNRGIRALPNSRDTHYDEIQQQGTESFQSRVTRTRNISCNPQEPTPLFIE